MLYDLDDFVSYLKSLNILTLSTVTY